MKHFLALNMIILMIASPVLSGSIRGNSSTSESPTIMIIDPSSGFNDLDTLVVITGVNFQTGQL